MKGRITVVENIYHQLTGEPADATHSNTRYLLSAELPCFLPPITVGEEWTALPDTWIKECSLITIKNMRETYQRYPSYEQRELDEEKIIEVSLGSNVEAGALVHPGDNARFTPVDFKNIRLRCRKASTSVIVRLYPK